jgi:uncharacterized protein YqcC (DUF446 family)
MVHRIGSTRLRLPRCGGDNSLMEMCDLDRQSELIDVVDQLEATLRRMRLWSDEPPSSLSLASEQPFCFDTLDFSEWLQWRLIPRMRRILAGDGDLPTQSAIHPYAEDCIEGPSADRTELLALIDRFDVLIRGHSAAVMH